MYICGKNWDPEKGEWHEFLPLVAKRFFKETPMKNVLLFSIE